MAAPQIEIFAVSNVYSRLMHFERAGDVEVGHSHTHNHGTLLSYGSVLYEVLDGPSGNTTAAKTFVAPSFIFVEKNKYHRITSLENGTVCACIHALRTIDSDLVSPDCFMEPIRSERRNHIFGEVEEKTGKLVEPMANKLAVL
jgi:hypothetical protein